MCDCPAPTALARAWQCWSAPLIPPRSAPFPEPALVMKNVIFSDAFCASAGMPARNSMAAPIGEWSWSYVISPLGLVYS